MRPVTPALSVSPQIRPEDVPALAARGVRLIVNNRPDGEEPGQPAGAEIEAAARAAGIDYCAVPVRGRPGEAEVRAVDAALAAAEGPALAFCRSGTRSVACWALAELAAGRADRDQVLRQAAGAGYDLSGMI